MMTMISLTAILLGPPGQWYYVRMDANCMYWLPYYGASSGTPSRPRPKATNPNYRRPISTNGRGVLV